MIAIEIKDINYSCELIEKLENEQDLTNYEFLHLLNMLDSQSETLLTILQEKSEKIRIKHYGKDVFIRGLIEFSNICKNNCFYCGIRSGNNNVQRYRLTKSEIMKCCEIGYSLGFRTFVLQGGEDPFFTDEIFSDIISEIKNNYKYCAITLSIGERPLSSYEKLKAAGADRFLLRFETSDSEHYSKLHPVNLNLENRLKCLEHLKECDYAVGTGVMIGSPFQTNQMLASDLKLLQKLKPQMVGVGPFIPHKDTVFANEKSGDLNKTLFILGLIRLILPKVLLPATTALSTICKDGRKLGIKMGCNVIMPNLSPNEVRAKYTLYNNKAYLGSEAAESLQSLQNELQSIGYKIKIDRGDAVL